MWRNYVVVAWRGLARHKIFTLINLFGLAVSMSVCLLLILLVIDQHSYDEFHPKKDQIHRILTFQNGSSPMFGGFASTTAAFKAELEGKYADIEKVTLLNSNFSGEVRSEHKVLDGKGYYGDPAFFEVFGFELSQGNPATALEGPYSIVLAEEYAKLLFPDGDAMGKLVEYGNHDSYMVTGIVAKPKGKTHVQFDMLASYSTLPALLAKQQINADYEDWTNVWQNHHYMLLREGADIQAMESEINKIAESRMKLPDDHEGYHFKLQSMDDVTPGLMLSNELAFTLPGIIIGFFMLLGLIVLVTATINYTNLSVAKSISRAKEVGVRKANGAGKWHIVQQFLVESVMLSVLSLAIAIGLYTLLVGEFNSLWIMSIINIQLAGHWVAYLSFFGFSIILGLLTGIGPALFLSKFGIVSTLRGHLSLKPVSKKRWYHFSGKKFMLGLQFAMAVVLIISIFLLNDQVEHMVNADYGFDDQQVFYIELQGHDPEVARAEFAKYHGTAATSLASHHPAVGRTYGGSIRRHKEDEPIFNSQFYVDKNYVQFMKIPLLAGESFPPTISAENESMTIVNETAARMLGFESTADIVGESIYINDTSRLKVIGLVKDYHYEPLMKEIRPLLLRYRPADFSVLYLKLQPGIAPVTARADIKKLWDNFDPRRDIRSGFLDEEMAFFYQFMRDISNILTLIATLALVITCLGLLGMVSFAMKARVKEIGIRKVLGADTGNLLWLLSREFGVLMAITLVVSVPIAVLGNSLWIDLMAYRAGVTVGNTLPGIIIVLALSMVVVLSQTWRVTASNPVNSLRSE